MTLERPTTDVNSAALSLGRRYASHLNTTEGVERFAGPWYTASMFVPSGSRT